MRTDTYPCAPPLPAEGMEALDFDVPAGACDAHGHVVAPAADYAFVESRRFTPEPAPERDYLAMLAATGMSRGVLVQISVYGDDNGYLLDVLGRHPAELRGVVVVGFDISDDELLRMHEAGVRAVRCSLMYGPPPSPPQVRALALRVHGLGWHVELLVDVAGLRQWRTELDDLPCTFVVDHMGHAPTSLGVQDVGFRTLLSLVRDSGWYVKLSGSYRMSRDFDGFADATPFARALLEAAPDRCVYGSDWPHVALASDRMVDTSRLLNQFMRWTDGDAALRRRVLVDNAARLYDFPRPTGG